MKSRDQLLLEKAYLSIYLKEQELSDGSANSNQTQTADIERQLTNAFHKGPAATRAFLNTELGKSAAVRHILAKSSNLTNKDPDSDTVTVSEKATPIPVDPATMIPTQNFIDMMKSISYPLGSEDSLINMLTTKIGHGAIVVDGKLIIDGHHRWSQVLGIVPEGQINARNVSWPGQNTSEKLAAAQLAIAGHIGPDKEIPSSDGEPATNILGKDASAIYQMILQYVGKQTERDAPGPLLNDEMIKQIAEHRQGKSKIIYTWCNLDPNETNATKIRQHIANKVSKNLSLIKSNDQAPGRPDMPQFDPKAGGPTLDSITSKLTKGELNVRPPFTSQQ